MTGENEVVEGQVEITEPEATQDSAQQEPSLDDIRSELERAKQELAQREAEVSRWQNEAKAHQKNVTKKDSEIQRLKAQEERINILTEMVADLVDAQGEPSGYEAPKKRRSEEYLSKLKTVDEQNRESLANEEKQRITALAIEADKLLQSKGLSMDSSPETKTAWALWRAGDYDESLEEVKKITQVEAKPETKETEEQIKARLKEEARREIMAERGELDTETGQPSGGSSGSGNAWARYARGEISEEEARKQGVVFS